MVLYRLTVVLHPSIISKNVRTTIKVDSTQKILDGLLAALKRIPEAYKILVNNNHLRPGFLFLSDKIELKTTNNLNKNITRDMEIKVIPISHGGV